MVKQKKKIEKAEEEPTAETREFANAEYPEGFAEADDDALAAFLQTVTPTAPVAEVFPTKEITLEQLDAVIDATKDLRPEMLIISEETRVAFEQAVTAAATELDEMKFEIDLPVVEEEKVDPRLTLAAYLGYDPDKKIEPIERLPEPVVPSPEEVQDAFATAPAPDVIECPNCQCVDASREVLNTWQYPVHRRNCNICGFAFGWNEIDKKTFQ